MVQHLCGDPADSPRAQVGFQYPEFEGEEEATGMTVNSAVDVLDFARWIVSYIRSKPKSRLTVDCLYIALGDAAIEGLSMTEIGRRHGVTKAAISKRVREVREDLHLPRTGFNKTEHACQTYRETNIPRISLDYA